MLVYFFSDAPLDLKIKSNMMSDLFSLVGKWNVALWIYKTVNDYTVHIYWKMVIFPFLKWIPNYIYIHVRCYSFSDTLHSVLFGYTIEIVCIILYRYLYLDVCFCSHTP